MFSENNCPSVPLEVCCRFRGTLAFLHWLLDQTKAERKSPPDSLSGRISRLQSSGKGASAIRVLGSWQSGLRFFLAPMNFNCLRRQPDSSHKIAIAAPDSVWMLAFHTRLPRVVTEDDSARSRSPGRLVSLGVQGFA